MDAKFCAEDFPLMEFSWFSRLFEFNVVCMLFMCPPLWASSGEPNDWSEYVLPPFKSNEGISHKKTLKNSHLFRTFFLFGGENPIFRESIKVSRVAFSEK